MLSKEKGSRVLGKSPGSFMVDQPGRLDGLLEMTTFVGGKCRISQGENKILEAETVGNRAKTHLPIRQCSSREKTSHTQALDAKGDISHAGCP